MSGQPKPRNNIDYNSQWPYCNYNRRKRPFRKSNKLHSCRYNSYNTGNAGHYTAFQRKDTENHIGNNHDTSVRAGNKAGQHHRSGFFCCKRNRTSGRQCNTHQQRQSFNDSPSNRLLFVVLGGRRKRPRTKTKRRYTDSVQQTKLRVLCR